MNAQGFLSKLPARSGILALVIMAATSAYWLAASSAADMPDIPANDGPGCQVVPTPTLSTVIWTNPSPIAPQDRASNEPGSDPGLPSLYPSILGGGLDVPESCALAKVEISFALTSERPDDLDILVVNPNGGRSIMISDAGGGGPVNNVEYTFTSFGGNFPDETAPPAGTYVPANYPGLAATEPNGFDNFPGVSGLTNYEANFNSVYGSYSGQWKLYVVDDEAGSVSSLPLGWQLKFTFMCNQPPTICTPTPTPTASPNPSPSCPVAGSLDTTFGGDGVVTTPVLSGVDIATSVAIQPDGRIVTAGWACAEPDGNCQFSGAKISFALTRHLQDGAVDTSFGSGGTVTTEFELVDRANDIALQGDGRIVVAGRSSTLEGSAFALARYNSDGTLDGSFGNGGKVLTSFPGSTSPAAYSLLIQPDGKIVAGGDTGSPASGFALARYNANGSLDAEFGNGGLVATRIEGRDSQALDIALQSDGRIVATGWALRSAGSEYGAFAAARYNTDGSLDTTFGTGGTVVTPVGTLTDVATSVAIQLDGKIVAAGSSYSGAQPQSDYALVRYGPDGTLDATFGTDGKAITPVAPGTGADSLNDIVIQPDGRIVAAGESASDVSLARLNSDGSLDTSFNGTGTVLTDLGPNFSVANAVALQNDGKIVVAGIGFGEKNYDIAVLRYGFTCSSPTPPPITPTPTPTPTLTPTPTPGTLFDYDGDRKADVSIFRPSNRRWYILQSQSGFRSQSLPIGNHRPTPADFDGDGKTDLSGYETQAPTTLSWLSSSPPIDFYSVRFGLPDDIPLPADHTGDRRADAVVFRPSNSTWYRRISDSTFVSTPFGTTGDLPVMGDFDGDGLTDMTVFRPSNGVWYRQHSSNGALAATQFGLVGDKLVPADYDGDGRTDIAVWRPSDGIWHISGSLLGYYAFQFGSPDDIPAPADYDGDGRADITVFRPSSGIWYRLNSSDGSIYAIQFGQNGDIPTPAAYVN